MSWLGEKKRTARLAHVGDEKDAITAHVDRIVKKNVLPQKLVEDWKPLKFRNAEYAREEVEQVEAEKERQQREDEHAEQQLTEIWTRRWRKKSGESWWTKTIQVMGILLKRFWITATRTKTGVKSIRCDSWATGRQGPMVHGRGSAGNGTRDGGRVRGREREGGASQARPTRRREKSPREKQERRSEKGRQVEGAVMSQRTIAKRNFGIFAEILTE